MSDKQDQEKAKAREDDELLAHGFDPEGLDESERADALAMISEQTQPPEDDPNPPAEPKAPVPKGLRYFKTRIAGLEVVIGDPDTAAGHVAPRTVRFVPYMFKLENGEDMKMGYLATNHPVALQKLEADGNVEEISKSEFKQRTDINAKGVRRLAY